jgi:RNA polymerase sigma factor (sigma-70 family)
MMDSKAVAQDFDDAFAVLYPRARKVALRILESVPDAEDAAAEALARALVRWKRLGQLAHREAWVLRVTANVAIDAARRRQVAPPLEARTVNGDDQVVLRLTLVAALAALPRRQREAVVLRHLAGFSEAEVCDALGVSQNTVKKHLQRGMARLRAGLTSDEEVSLALD